jgi:predicted ester cyclase
VEEELGECGGVSYQQSGCFDAATGMQQCHITVVDIARIVDGRIVEHWGVPDRFALLAQTGVLSRLT